jgi:hypothetical protein
MSVYTIIAVFVEFISSSVYYWRLTIEFSCFSVLCPNIISEVEEPN